MKKIQHIMVVDDDDITNFITEKYLNKLNIAESITIYNNSESALAFLTQDKKTIPDVILLDINMPVMDGFLFLEECRKQDLCGHFKVLMLTSSIREEDRLKSKEFPCVVGYIEKPLTMDALSILNDN